MNTMQLPDFTCTCVMKDGKTTIWYEENPPKPPVENWIEFNLTDGELPTFHLSRDGKLSIVRREIEDMDCVSDYALDSTARSVGKGPLKRIEGQGGDWSKDRDFKWWQILHREGKR